MPCSCRAFSHSYFTNAEMIQFHTHRPSGVSVRTSCATVITDDGEYRAFRTSDGGYINGPFGFLRVFRSPEALIEGIQALA